MNTWDRYWQDKSGSGGVYDVIAGVYRRNIIRPRLETVLRKTFLPRSRLLHAGCGSGEVDARLTRNVPVVGPQFKIKAVDASVEACRLYAENNPDGNVRQADIFSLVLAGEPYDGVYNLGVLEHFTRPDILRMLAVFRSLLKPTGKLVFFWPHSQATSVAVLGLASKVMRKSFHPPEPSLCRGADDTRQLFLLAGFWVDSFQFGPGDGFVQAIVVASPINGR